MSLTLDNLLNSLAVGELASLEMANEGAGGIQEEEQPRVMAALNDTIQRLNNQFLMERRTFILNILEGQDTYVLDPRLSQSAGEVDSPIDDTLGKPLTDVMQILSLRDSISRDPLPINDDSRVDSITALPEVIHLSSKRLLKAGVKKLFVEYRPEFRNLPLRPTDFEVEIPVPAVLHGALRAGIAANIFHAIGGQNALATANIHESRYTLRCQEIAMTDVLAKTESAETKRPRDNGWP